VFKINRGGRNVPIKLKGKKTEHVTFVNVGAESQCAVNRNINFTAFLRLTGDSLAVTQI
jgi:hypothetical protein